MIRAKFAYYYEDGKEGFPSYLIIESDDKNLPIGANVGEDMLINRGLELPWTPSLMDWIKMKRPIYRGGRERP